MLAALHQCSLALNGQLLNAVRLSVLLQQRNERHIVSRSLLSPSLKPDQSRRRPPLRALGDLKNLKKPEKTRNSGRTIPSKTLTHRQCWPAKKSCAENLKVRVASAASATNCRAPLLQQRNDRQKLSRPLFSPLAKPDQSLGQRPVRAHEDPKNLEKPEKTRNSRRTISSKTLTHRKFWPAKRSCAENLKVLAARTVSAASTSSATTCRAPVSLVKGR